MSEIRFDRRMFSRLRRSHEAARGARGAIGIIVSMVQRRARFLDVRACVWALSAIEQRSKGQEQLSDGEEKDRRTPECSR